MSSPTPNPLGYTNLPVPNSAAKRSVIGWIILFILWTIGLGVWAVYITALVYLFFRILAR
jgi:hypothetical protein